MNPSFDKKFLVHYGVKGMKWGVRREAKRNFRRYKTEVVRRSQTVRWEISKADYDRMSAKPIKLGKDFNRITEKNNTNLRDFVYVTNNKRDRDIYRAFFGPGSDPRKANNKSELSIKTSKEAVSPGEKVRVDTYIETLKSNLKNKEFEQALREQIPGMDAAKALNAREIGFQTYMQFAQAQGMGTPTHTEYFDRLRKKGYTAVVDDADRGIISNTPIIIFPKESGARVTEIKPITKQDILQAKLDLKPLD